MSSKDQHDTPRYRGVVCDLDGTVYLSGRPFPGAVEALLALRAAGVRVLFVSNNPHRDAEAYARRLADIGLPTSPEDILTSGAVTASWVAENLPGARALVLGEESLIRELTAVGVKLVEKGDEADVVVASFDRTFTYARWTEAFRAIRAGARFIATNPDPTCPVDDGEIPDCGGIIAALEVTTGRPVEHVMGKPSPLMVEAALRRLMLDKEDVLVVGDRLGTDIELGCRAGIDSAMVLTGVSTREQAELSASRPTYVLESLADLPGIVGARKPIES
ncbi:MAG TPA: HAD-IIA family hydrolase [Actinopolymorphaceae bacterium]